MRCDKSGEILERYYKDKTDPFIAVHISVCSECRDNLKIVASFDSILLEKQPSQKTDRYILKYALEKLYTASIRHHIVRIASGFAVAVSIFMFVFFPANKKYDMNDLFFARIIDIERDIDEIEYENYFSYFDEDFLIEIDKKEEI